MSAPRPHARLLVPSVLLAISLIAVVAPAAGAAREPGFARHDFVLSLQAGRATTTASSTCPVPPTDLCTDYNLGKWRWKGSPIPYAINPADGPDGSVIDLQDAFQTWEDEMGSPAVEVAYPGDGSSIDYSFIGMTATAASRNDGVNVVYFDRCDPSRCGIASVSLYTRGSTLAGFDMRFNVNAGWGTDTTCPHHNCGVFDLQNIAAHEVGHTAALFHVTSEADALLSMYPGGRRDEVHKRDLGAGEVLGLRAAYPA